MFRPAAVYARRQIDREIHTDSSPAAVILEEFIVASGGRMSAWFRIVAGAVGVAAMTACSTDGAGGDLADTAAPDASPPRALTRSEEAVVGASLRFGFELAARTAEAEERPNIVLSPLGASMALGIAMNGAGGATFDAMREALGFGALSRAEINGGYRELIDLLAERDPNVRLEIANAVWANEEVPFQHAFLQAVTAAFDARVGSMDFSDPSAVTTINDWVAENTKGMIDGIVDALDPSLVMLLTNAVFFDGSWTTSFDPEETRRAAFQREDGSTVEVDMMSLRNVEMPRGGDASYSAVELPYGDGGFAMVIVLPQPGTSARDFLANLDADRWNEIVDALAPGRIDLLSLPKVTLTFDTYLNDTLIAMGMEPAFTPGADFTPLSPLGRQMCIDFVRQKTRVEIDERGTRAAAATSVGIGVVSFNAFVADRPFIFAIRERFFGTVLFVGLVGDPTAEDRGARSLVSTCTGTVLTGQSE